MRIADFLAAADVVRVAAPDKARLLQALSHQAAERFALDEATVVRALAGREALGSTGVGNGIALPHARIDGIRTPRGLFTVLAKPIQYGAVDDRPVDLVFLLLLPADVPEDQLRCLACVARRFKEPGLPDALRTAKEPSRIYDILVGG